MTPRPAVAKDLPGLQALHALCHPTWPERPPTWWWAHPTLVVTRGGLVIGSTSFTISTATDRDFATRGAELAYGHGVSVHPASRGQGLGWAVFQARHAILKELGVRCFIGMTQPGNLAMLRMFEQHGLAYHARIAAYYPDGTDGLMYSGLV